MLPESHQIIIRTQVDTSSHSEVLDGLVGEDGRLILEGCGPVERWLAALMHCDSLRITQDMIDGFPVSTPTTSRSFSRAQRRALRARDRHCRFPGCGRRWHLHAHHTDEWAGTNRTSVARAVLLCPQHHALIHLRGHRISLGPDHSVVVTRPDNTSIRGAPLPPPPPEVCTRPPDPSPQRRLTGLGEPLSYEARSTYIQHWHHLDDRTHTPEPAPP
jgi:hypothetical protein